MKSTTKLTGNHQTPVILGHYNAELALNIYLKLMTLEQIFQLSNKAIGMVRLKSYCTRMILDEHLPCGIISISGYSRVSGQVWKLNKVSNIFIDFFLYHLKASVILYKRNKKKRKFSQC